MSFFLTLSPMGFTGQGKMGLFTRPPPAPLGPTKFYVFGLTKIVSFGVLLDKEYVFSSPLVPIPLEIFVPSSKKKSADAHALPI